MKTAFCILTVVLFIETSFAAIIHVPADYPTPFFAVGAANEGDTVIVAPGTYHGGVLYSNVNVILASEFLLTGNPFAITGTIIDNELAGHVIQISGNEINETTQIVGLTITAGMVTSGGGIYCVGASPVIRDNIIADNFADAGGGIYCTDGAPKILRNTIRDNDIISPIGNPGGGICCINDNGLAEIAFNVIVWNTNQDGAGIACVNSNPWIHHNVIAQNHAYDLGGAIRCDDSSPMIEYNVIADNEANSGGGLYLLSSSPAIFNCIVWGNEATSGGQQIHVVGPGVALWYCDIEGGWTGQDNINSDPLFRDPVALDYHLSFDVCGSLGNSPCVDAADPVEFDSLDFCNWGLGLPRADMGAYGGLGDSVESSVTAPPLAQSHLMCSAYPNPFNASTTLEFSLPLTSEAKLSVFNTLGREVYHRDLGILNSGTHSHYFDARNLSSGLYLVRLQTSYTVANIKLLLLK